MHRPAMTAKEADLDRAVRNSIQASLDHHTFLWWTFLSLIALANMAVWVWSYLTIDTTGAASCPAHHPYQRHHLHLSGVYVFVCAYRSFWPRIDLERYCLFDTFASSVALGRSAATVAEVSFAAQIALWLYHVGAIHGHAHLQHLALGLVPAIATAQVSFGKGRRYAHDNIMYIGNLTYYSSFMSFYFKGLLLVRCSDAESLVPCH